MDGEEVLESSDVYREIYEVVEKIGEGGFGKVFSVLNKETKETFAAKCIKTCSRRDKSKPKEEIRLLKSLHNDFIIKFVDAFEGPTEIIVVTEYLAGGELFERIADDQFELLESDCCFFMRQVCRGLDYLHRNSIVHLDIKPENIVLRGKEGRNIKIIDFGTALKLVPGKKVQNMVGTPEFMAPEVVNYEDIALETDQWSVGVLSYILLSGYSPFLEESDDQKTMSNVTMAKYDFDYEEFEEVSPDAKDFITRLLRKSPARRLTASACLDHSWLKEKLMRKKTTRIKVTNLRKFLTRRKVQNIGRALRVINVFKGAAKDSRSSSEGLLDSDRTMTSETVDLEAMMKEDTRSRSEGLLDSEERDIENLDRTMTSETVDLEAMMKEDTSDEEEEGLAKEGIPENEEQSQDDLQVKRVNFDSIENTINSYSQETVDDTSDEDDFISTFHESEDTFDEVIREKKPEPIKTLGLRRTASRAAPGTVKKLMARFQNP